MGYLGGFKVTIGKFTHSTETGKVLTREYLGGKGGPEDLKATSPSGCTGATSSTATRTAWKSASAASCAPVSVRRCIYVRGADNDPESPTSPGERFGFVYEINYLQCIHCDLCVEACPTEAITETKMFSSASPIGPTPSTPRTSCWSTTGCPSSCRGRTGASATTPTRPHG